jgi:very-short-patch-repair endonuclease/ATP-dependent exoDNAse (exonuclease V) alpha subunit
LGGVSEFAASKYDDPNYVELQALPMFDEDAGDPFDTEAGRKLLGRIRRDRNRQTIFLGYPVRLNLLRSRKGWEGFMVEPLLLFACQETDTRHGNPTLTDDLPQINFRALRALSNAGETSLMEEAIQLAEELGLGNAAGEQPDLDELLARLREIRSDWDWQEEIDPYALSSGTPLSGLNQQGIFNRGILIAAERSPYTKGLESELGMLQSVEEGKYQATALGAWLKSQTIHSPPADQQPLLEVLPLNSEQRQAVRQALSNPLTVITGPPGTGKSQVVMSILVNAARQGKTVLFASKNNKAVDVVETRVNALGPRPVLLRLGANQYQSRLAEYLASLLAASATADDHERYRENEAIHAGLQQRSDALGADLQTLVDLRNALDRLEQQVEPIRQEIGEEAFRRLRGVARQDLTRAAGVFLAAVDQANGATQRLFARLAWRFVCKARFGRLAKAGRSFQEISQQIGLSIPEVHPDSPLTVGEWIQYGTRVAQRVSQVTAALQYFETLAALTAARSLEELSRQWKKLTEDLSENSELLWQTWLRLQPSRLGPEQRKLLGDYSALLQMIVSANDQSRQLGRDVFRRYYQLFPQITSILSCWAVTSLSARGRVPFDPNFFDVLVIDEASQCDIASALPLLYRARRVVVIGDPMQLRHISTLSKQQDQQLLSKHSLLDDHPGWAYSARSLFDLASSLCRSEDIVALRDHHRSHADIIQFSNDAFYEGRLRVATNYDRLRRPRLDEPAVRWVDVQGKTVRPGSGGAVNEAEAQAVVKEIERLISQGYRGSIGVVSPFRAQVNRVRDLVYGHDSLAARIAHADFLADTVHKFQGDERDVMIFSPVVSSGVSDGPLGFLRSNPNLFNVAITRARAALIVVGDKGAALNCNVDYLARFAAYSGQVGNRDQPVATATAIDLGPGYPAVPNPERVSEWEHLFYRALYRAGVRPVPQYSVEKYVLDFAVLDGERRLNIEIDGERYHRNWDGELCRRDQIRNQRLMELGWDVVRFWVYQIRDDLAHCVARVQEWTGRQETKAQAEPGA